MHLELGHGIPHLVVAVGAGSASAGNFADRGLEAVVNSIGSGFQAVGDGTDVRLGEHH